MKKLGKVALLGTLGLGLTSVGAESAHAIEESVNVGEEFASYGYSLDNNQRENTKKLLEAVNVEEGNEITMTTELYADIFDRNDPSSIGNIYSSAYVKYEEEGYGVDVNIVTPDTILEVSEESYINAAITSGMKDATINVASVTNVSGTGALSGIYAIQKELGIEVDPEVAKLSNQELALNSELEDEIALEKEGATEEETNALTNGLLADIKKEIADLAQDKGGEVGEGEARDIVINIVNNYGLNLSDEAIQKLIDFAKQFSQTEIALSPEMQEQLSKLGNTLKEQGGKAWDGIKSTLSDEDVQESAKGVWNAIVTFFKNLFSSATE